MTAMRFGVVLPHFRAVASAMAIRDVAQAAEALGFDAVWVTDRAAVPAGPVAGRFGPAFYDPLVTLAAVAAATERVRLGASVFVLPFRHPVLMARALASLDQLSAGRLIVGVGAGWMREEFDAIGVPFHERGRLTDEYLEAILTLWASPIASFAGRTVLFEDLVSEPRPAQHPCPPIWVGGGTPAALRRTVRHADAWHGSPAPLAELRRIVAALGVEARRQGRDSATIPLTTRAPLAVGDRRPDGAGPDDPAGTPDEVLAAVRRYAEAGFVELALDTFFAHSALGDEPPAPDTMLRTLRTFADEVMPALRE